MFNYKKLILIALIAFVACTNTETENKTPMKEANEERPQYAMVIHGGAGTITRDNMSAEMEEAYRAALDTALMIGKKMDFRNLYR